MAIITRRFLLPLPRQRRQRENQLASSLIRSRVRVSASQRTSRHGIMACPPASSFTPQLQNWELKCHGWSDSNGGPGFRADCDRRVGARVVRLSRRLLQNPGGNGGEEPEDLCCC